MFVFSQDLKEKRKYVSLFYDFLIFADFLKRICDFSASLYLCNPVSAAGLKSAAGCSLFNLAVYDSGSFAVYWVNSSE